MATETTSSSGGNGFLYFIVGVLVVAVGIIGFMAYNGSFSQSPTDRAIERSADAVGDAAKSVGNAVDPN